MLGMGGRVIARGAMGTGGRRGVPIAIAGWALACCAAAGSEFRSDLVIAAQVQAGGLFSTPPPIVVNGQPGPVDRQRFAAIGLGGLTQSHTSTFARGRIARGSMRIDFLSDAFSTNGIAVADSQRTVNLFATYDDWVITGPVSGPGSVETRLRIQISTTNDFGVVGPGNGTAAYRFHAFAGGFEQSVAWLDGVQVEGSASNVYLSDPMTFPVNQPFSFAMGLMSDLSNFGHLLMGAPAPGGNLTSAATATVSFGGPGQADGASGPVFVLPEGYSLESESANIHGNVLLEPIVPAPGAPGLAAVAGLCGARRRRTNRP